jgi:hypothetical protein
VETQIDVDVIDAGTADQPARVRWYACDNGMTVGEGFATYEPGSQTVNWEDHPPSASLFGRVVLAIDRAVKRRLGIS